MPRRKPNFIFIGPDKTGSSWLYRNLSAHPHVFLAPAKDIYFFDRYYERGSTWYFDKFRAAQPDARVVGEVCHDYIKSELVAERIKDTLDPPSLRLMAFLREPLDRAYSDYLNRIRSGIHVNPDFASALREDPTYLGSGQYWKMLEPYWERFPERNILTVPFDALRADPQHVMDCVTSFLDLSRIRLSMEQAAPARAASVSRSSIATKTLRTGANLARHLGWEDLVGRVKGSRRVESALYKPVTAKLNLRDPVFDEIRSNLKPGVGRLQEKTGHPLLTMWGYE